MNIILLIDSYLKELSLSSDVNLVSKILTFLERKINTENAIDNEDKIVKLFLRSIESLNQDDSLEEDLKNKIIKAFENIRTIENNSTANGEMRCMCLLNFLYSKNKNYNEIPESEFSLLLDNLEKIRVIFKLCDKQNNQLFPIGNLLFRLINSENLLTEIGKVSSIQALMLALQIFDSSKYPSELNSIKLMLRGKNLRFIEYLFNKSFRIGKLDWKNNYEKNGLLVLYDAESNKVLIRNNKRSYFNTAFDKYNYNYKRIDTEINSKNEPIAYFVEYSLENFRNVDLKKELSRENNIDHISQILDIIYYYKNYNVLSESALFEINGRIYPINPFGENDSFVVYGGNSFKDRKKVVSEFLYNYGLLQVVGVGVKYVNLGALVKMEEIFAIPSDKFNIMQNSFLDDVLRNWLKQCKDKQKCFYEFFNTYESQISYIYSKKSIFEKKYRNEFIVPNSIPESILDDLQFDKIFSQLIPEKSKVSFDLMLDAFVIETLTSRKLLNYQIEDIDGEELTISEGEIIALIDDNERKVYVGKQVDDYYFILDRLKQINSVIPNNNVLFKVKENDINDLVKKMNCFRDAFSIIHPCIPMESITRYRILNHLILLNPNESDVISWLNIIEKHEVLDYSIVKGKSPIENIDGILYVPKERGRAQSTLKYVNDRYFNNPIQRSIVDIYDQKVTQKDGFYYTGCKKIEKIVLLFDNIQNGKNTNETIDFYIRNKGNFESKRMTFICNGKEISVSEILNANKCQIELYSIYASDNGIKNIKEHISQNYPNINICVLPPIKTITNVVNDEDIEIIKKLYPQKFLGGIRTNCYMVVREYNQPKLNVMCDQLLNVQYVAAFFCKRPEL